MSDLIRREEAIEMLQEAIDSYPPTMKGQGRTRDSTLEEAIDLIESIPTAEPKVGKWISVSSFEAFGGDEICWEIRGNPTAFHYCSACKEQAYVDEFGNEILSKYCPNCGAKLERSE